MIKSKQFVPALVLAGSLFGTAITAIAQEAKAPANSETKPEKFNPRKFMNGTQATYLSETSWITPEIIAKLEEAQKKWPESRWVQMYLGRVAGYNKDIDTAEKYLLGNNSKQARGYLLFTYWESEQFDKFKAYFDESPFQDRYLNQYRIELALKEKDWTSIETYVLLEKSVPKLMKNIIDMGVQHNNPQWSYDVLGRLALRTPADEKGSKILTQLFAERDKIKILFPEKVRD